MRGTRDVVKEDKCIYREAYRRGGHRLSNIFIECTSHEIHAAITKTIVHETVKRTNNMHPRTQETDLTHECRNTRRSNEHIHFCQDGDANGYSTSSLRRSTSKGRATTPSSSGNYNGASGYGITMQQSCSF